MHAEKCLSHYSPYEKEYTSSTAAKAAAKKAGLIIDAYWKLAKAEQLRLALQEYPEQLSPTEQIQAKEAADNFEIEGKVLITP